MGDIVNLRRARKDKAKREREAEADANRRRFGRTLAQKEADRDTAERAARLIDGKRLEPEKDQVPPVISTGAERSEG